MQTWPSLFAVLGACHWRYLWYSLKQMRAHPTRLWERAIDLRLQRLRKETPGQMLTCIPYCETRPKPPIQSRIFPTSKYHILLEAKQEEAAQRKKLSEVPKALVRPLDQHVDDQVMSTQTEPTTRPLTSNTLS